MGETLEARVRTALASVRDAETGLDIVAGGLVEGVLARDGMVQVTLHVPRARAPGLEPLRAAAERAAAAVPGVLSATVVLTAHREPTPAAPARRTPHAPAGQGAMLMPETRFIIAIASGKGGVGKSTTAVNIAVAMAARFVGGGS